MSQEQARIKDIIESAQVRQQAKYSYVLTSEQTQQITSTQESIYVSNPLSDKFKTYPLPLAQIITSTPQVFEQLQNFFNDKNASNFVFVSPQASSNNEQDGTTYTFSRYDVVSLLQSYSMRDDATKEQEDCYNALASLVSTEKLIEDFARKKYTINIDGQNATFKCSDLISILTASPEALASIPPKVAAATNTRQQFYALSHLVKDSNIFENYFLGRETETTFKSIRNSEYVDIEAFNKLLKVQNDYLDRTQISPELTAQVLKGMPADLSKLEQAQFVYIVLCKTLSYDQTYFAAGQKGPLAQKHKDISYLPNVSPQNNESVCYEFSAIYSKMLSDLNINNELVFAKTKKDSPNPYGHRHSYVRFRADEYLVTADPTRLLSASDLARVKLGMLPENLHLKNNNAQTAENFNASLCKINEIVQNIHSQDNNSDATYSDTMRAYEALNGTPNFTTKEKFDFFLETLSQSNLPAMEVLSYAYFLSEAVFSGEELQNFNISQIRHTPNFTAPVSEQTAELGLVVSMGNSAFAPSSTDGHLIDELSDDYFVDTKGYTRAFYSSSTGLTDLNSQEMFVNFGTGKFSYIFAGSPPVPGGPHSTAEYVLNVEA